MMIYQWVYDNYRIMTMPWDSVYTYMFALVMVDYAAYWWHRGSHGECENSIIKPLLPTLCVGHSYEYRYKKEELTLYCIHLYCTFVRIALYERIIYLL